MEKPHTAMLKANRLYLAFNKPYGVLSQFTQNPASNKRTLAEFDFPPRVYPLGRLDYDSEGLLLLSDDGGLNQALLHPTNRHKRTYLVQVENIPTINSLNALRHSVIIQGQKSLPATVELLDQEPVLPPREIPIRFRKNIPTSWLRLTISEGKNRQVRHMTAAIGHPTLRLIRIAIGNLKLAQLKLTPGLWKKLTLIEMQKVFETP